MAQNITLMGASYSAVPSVTLPKTGGGTASFTDVSDTTATADDVASGTYFYTAAGVRTEGTSSGGGVNNVVISWEDMMGTVTAIYYPNNATEATDPDQPWIRTYTLPENSLLAGFGPAMPGMSPSVSGLTMQAVNANKNVFYVFYVGTTNGSISS